MALTVRELEESGALQEISNLFSTREDALYLLGNIPDLPKGRLPNFDASDIYWRRVAELFEKGLVKNGLEALTAAAAKLFPGNAKLEIYAAKEQSGPVKTLVIEIPSDNFDEEMIAFFQLAKILARNKGGDAKLDIVTKGSTKLHVSFEGLNDAQVEDIARLIQEKHRDLRVQREEHTFPDYYMDPLYAEGPDLQRFALDRVRASTRVGEVAHGIMDQYDSAFWPTDKAGHQAPPIVDLHKPSGETQRIPSNQTLHDAGVRPHDTLSISPERRAGSVNPFLRAESLTILRNQILDFANHHPGFEVEANSVDIPTEYLFRFEAPSFAPGDPPRRIDRHEVLLVTPPEFPVKAPQAYWQHDIFHPNVHPTYGLVCLGVLDESYRPGLHFGTLCQMLIDMASYKNYELTEGYNKEAAAWAASDAGQAAILAIGGRSREEVLGLVREGSSGKFTIRRVTR